MAEHDRVAKSGARIETEKQSTDRKASFGLRVIDLTAVCSNQLRQLSRDSNHTLQCVF